MRVMVIVKATRQSEAGIMPKPDLLERMGKFNEELIKAGVMMDGAGLKPTSQGRRLKFSVNDSRSVYNGPFGEPKDEVAGFWIWQVASVDEAMEWLKKCPHPHPGEDCELEVRPLMEEADFVQ
jgi:hypothetical protein